MGHRAGPALLHRQGRLGAVQGLDLAFSSMHSTTAFSGGFRYRPTTSISFSSKWRSLDTLKVFTKWGLSPRADQIRCTGAGLTPTRAAIDRHDQCVSPSRFECSVRSTISAT